MSVFNDLPKGFCRAYGGEARQAATASLCREVNGCTVADCPLEDGGERSDPNDALRLLGSGFALSFLTRSTRPRD